MDEDAALVGRIVAVAREVGPPIDDENLPAKNARRPLGEDTPHRPRAVGKGRERSRVNCHHNFTQREVHDGRPVWLTRKGAIKADMGDRGVIPGSMGAATYVVEGLGNAASFSSCSHGAGRRLSRTAARNRFSGRDLAARMGDRTWQARDADALVDEIPDAYKDIDQVMADQADLVRVQHTLRQVLNLKGS